MSLNHIINSPSTTADELIELCNSLKINLVFIGYKDQITTLQSNSAYIINLHNHNDIQDKSTLNHWTGFYVNKKNLYYFDSFSAPPPDTIIMLGRKYKKKIYYNTSIYQNLRGGNCGQYCCYFLKEVQTKGIKTYQSMDKYFKVYDKNIF